MGNPLQQLDLFGMPVETSPSPKPKKQVVKKAVESVEPNQQNQLTSSDPIKMEVPIQMEDPTEVQDNNQNNEEQNVLNDLKVDEPVVYASNQIVVKVKSKTEPTVVSVEPSPSKKTKVADKIKVVGKRGRKSFKEMDAVADLIEIPSEEMLKQKLYYSISEVASWFKVNTSLLRYWENEFDILQPRKTRKGDRLFRVEDIKNLQLIYLLLRQRKFSIEGAKSYLKNNKKKIDTETQLVQSLTTFKQFLLELKSSLSN